MLINRSRASVAEAAALFAPLLLLGCVTGPIRYNRSIESTTTKVRTDPGGAQLVSSDRYGFRSALAEESSVRLTRQAWKETEWMLLPFPFPTYSNKPSENDWEVQSGLSVQWPSGARAPLPKTISRLQPITINHPDPTSSRRRKYDELAEHDQCKQLVQFTTFPSTGLISGDGHKFSSGPTTATWSFDFAEFNATQKSVIIYAKWPSGVMVSNAVIPILTTSERPQLANVVISHPFPNSAQFAYDSLRQQRADVTFDSDPTGADVYAGGKLLGTCPVVLGSDVSFADFSATSAVWELTAKWKSGATKTDTIVVNMRSVSPKTHTFVRPSTSVGYTEDTLGAKARVWELRHSSTNPTKAIVLTSDPEGATIYEGTRRQGQCPLTLQWEFTKESFLAGAFSTTPLVARWPSGATAEKSFTIRYEDPTSGTFAFIRPSAAPNVELDVKYALELRQIDAYRTVREREQHLQSLAIQQEQSRANAESMRQEVHLLEQSRLQSERLQMEQSAALRRQQSEQDLMLYQQRMLAETERANRARESSERNAQTLQSIQMLNQSLQNVNSTAYRNQYNPNPASTYEIKSKTIDLVPHDGVMDAGSYLNPYVIERK